MGNVVFFNGTDGSGQTLSDDLWVSDGTAAGTFAVGGARNAGVAGTDGGLIHRTSLRSQAEFCSTVLAGYRASGGPGGLWFSDGTAAGTYEIGEPTFRGSPAFKAIGRGTWDRPILQCLGTRLCFSAMIRMI